MYIYIQCKLGVSKINGFNHPKATTKSIFRKRLDLIFSKEEVFIGIRIEIF